MVCFRMCEPRWAHERDLRSGRGLVNYNRVPDLARPQQERERHGNGGRGMGKTYSVEESEALLAFVENVRCWMCPDCGFTMDATHLDDETGLYSCPNCLGGEIAEPAADAGT